MAWQIVAYASLAGGFFGLAASCYFFDRVCRHLATVHPETFRALGEPSILRPGGWRSSTLRDFLRSRGDAALDDPEFAVLCRRFRACVRVAAAFAAVAFVAVFADAFARAS